MLHIILIAGALVAITVAIHAVGLGIVLSRWAKLPRVPPTRFWPITWLLIRLAWFLILIHLVEIAVWGLYYRWQECLPDAESAFYFAGVTYTSIGYGDLVLKQPWRMLAPVEGLAGILMCGLSAGIFFAVVSWIVSQRDMEQKIKL